MTADENDKMDRGSRSVHGSRVRGAASPAPRSMGRTAYRPRNLATLRFRIVKVIEEQLVSHPVPIWAAALAANHCRATANGQDRTIQWECEGGRVLYTNMGAETERIEPLDVSLRGGQTLAVSWIPGETGYTLEVFRRFECCA